MQLFDFDNHLHQAVDIHTVTIPFRAALTAATCALLLAACATDEPAPEPPITNKSENSSATARLAISYDGGIMIVDAATLKTVGETTAAGFLRLNPAGDGRHVIVSAGDSFDVLDAGTWSREHGDHAHHYTSDPVMTDIVFAAEEPGHVVRHAGRTVLFDDGTGEVTSFDPADLADGQPPTSTHRTPDAHHGVAVELQDGSMLTTVGTEDERTGVVVTSSDGRELARTDVCPGVHGEAVAVGEAVVLGCEDGLVVYRDGAIRKAQSPDPYGRIGNQAGDDTSRFVLGDYKSDPDAELERPTRVSITDTDTATVRLVDLGTSYTFRSLGRGPTGEALVLGTDGAIHIVDPMTATVSRSIPVIDSWSEPDEWQSPRPALYVQDGTAFVTDPSTSTIHAVDVVTGTVTATTELNHLPNELTGVTG
ncbi:zinc metallochaperone AztD [Actinomycetes bacterium M1A6_2h]